MHSIKDSVFPPWEGAASLLHREEEGRFNGFSKDLSVTREPLEKVGHSVIPTKAGIQNRLKILDSGSRSNLIAFILLISLDCRVVALLAMTRLWIFYETIKNERSQVFCDFPSGPLFYLEKIFLFRL
jgi:hypothetical protein